MQGEEEITLLNVKPTVVFTLSWAGVTPAPSIRKKARMRADALLEGFGREDAKRNSCPAVADNPRRFFPKNSSNRDPTSTQGKLHPASFLNTKVQGLTLPKESVKPTEGIHVKYS